MKKLALVLLIATYCSSANAANLLTWNTTGNAGTETTEPSVSNLAGVASSSLTLGAGVTAAANGNRFGGNGWFDTGDTNPTTLAESVAGNDYIQFTLTPNAGSSVTITSFQFIWGRSGTGPSSLTLRSSADSFVANLATATGVADSTSSFTTLSFSMTNVTTAVTFRLYGYAATAAAGTGGFDTVASAPSPNVLLVGSVVAVPEPHEYGVAIVGLLGVMILIRRRGRAW